MAGDLAVVILAAGKGTRLKSARAKVLHEAGGLPLLAHALRACARLARRERTGAEAWVVVGHQADAVRRVAEGFGARAVLQQPQLGTGHAVERALAALPRRIARVLVLPGDAPLLQADSLQLLLRAQAEGQAAGAVLTALLADPTNYGRIVRDPAGDVEAIIEQSALRPDQLGLREVNSGVYCFDRAAVAPLFARLKRDNVHREYYLTDIIALLRTAGQRVVAQPVSNPEEILGVNRPAELARVDALLHRRKAEALMSCGVTLYQPESQAIDPDVSIGSDTIVERGVELRGSTRIGRGCRIGAFSILRNATLGDNVVVNPSCLVLNSRVGAGVTLGPFAHLRDGADIRPGARIGNYVEVKKSTVREGAKALHLTYLGDATVGRNTNVGAGTITCNYDGQAKHPTTIGEDVFVGSGTELVAPVKVGKGAYIAAGSTVTENIPAESLAIARGRQVNKPGWVKSWRRLLAAAKARKARARSPRASARAPKRRRPAKRSRRASRRRR